MNIVLHLARTEARQHRALLVVWLAVVLARGLLIGSGVDLLMAGRPLPVGRFDSDPVRIAYLILGIGHIGLLMGIAAQLIQSDRLVGTTAFWLTRPVHPWHLLASKAILIGTSLIVVPIAVDALVLATHGLPWSDVGIAMGLGTATRLAAVVPVLALAAVTGDLAAFVVAVVGATVGLTLAAVAVSEALRALSTGTSRDSGVPMVMGLAWSTLLGLLALAYQTRTRRRGRSMALMAAAGIGAIVLVGTGTRRLWSLDVPTMEPSLEAGWLDAAGLRAALSPVPVTRARLHAVYPARVEFSVTPPAPHVVVVPLKLEGRFHYPGGQTGIQAMDQYALGPSVMTDDQSANHRNALTGLLPGVAIAGELEPRLPRYQRVWVSVWPQGESARLVGPDTRYEGEMLAAAIGHRVVDTSRLEPGRTFRAAGHRLSILSAACSTGGCEVRLRDASAGFAPDPRRASGLRYLLRNRTRHLAVPGSDTTIRTYGWPVGVPLSEHLQIAHRILLFRPPPDRPELLDSTWLEEAELVVVEVRDVGRVRLPVAMTNLAAWFSDAPSPEVAR